MTKTEVLIIGAGAAGLMCAAQSLKRGRKVILIDHNPKPGRKIIISGGGRCNFTNLNIQADRYLSQNPRFCISALKRYTQHDFIKLVEKHNIPYHEKKLGQLFCDNKSVEILNMLLDECDHKNFTSHYNCTIASVQKKNHGYKVETSSGSIETESLVIATGGLSIPKIGATSFAYKIAEQFDINLLPLRAGLVPLTLTGEKLELAIQLAGASVDCIVSVGKKNKFRENILFTHRGLSGPAILQISSYWQEGQNINLDFLPDEDSKKFISNLRKNHAKETIASILKPLLPKKFIQLYLKPPTKPIGQLSQKELNRLQEQLFSHPLLPAGTEGYRTAEVTLGGIDTKELSSKTMEAQKVPGLYFIGEAVDVTGWLGGYNFQWAWSSASAAAEYV